MLGTLKKIFAFAGNRKGLLKKSLFFSFLNGIFASFQFGALYFIVDALPWQFILPLLIMVF